MYYSEIIGSCMGNCIVNVRGITGQSRKRLCALLYREDIKINTSKLPIKDFRPADISNKICFEARNFTGKGIRTKFDR